MIASLVLAALLASARPDVSIGLGNGTAEVDGRVTYVVEVVNRESKPVTADVRMTFPRGLARLQAEQGELGKRQASWSAELPPGPTEFRLTGVLKASPGSHVAATACLFTVHLSRPVSCATDIDAVAGQPVTPGRGVVNAVLVLAALASGAGASYLMARGRGTPVRPSSPSAGAGPAWRRPPRG
ncbi:hypothetical protein [Acrocarpospora catenulata]|uniref:hypothetical protein n=1 Tax=Acrocarpospora catenulata TaxID=2836182 RepID=UPI001BDABC83|nr:hypothetical protein [Acrocarpospora catenulata]